MDINNYIASGNIELYVLGMCSHEEKLEMEQLRKQNAAIDEAIKQYEINLEKSWMKLGEQPPAFADEKILQQLNVLTKPAVKLFNEDKKSQRLVRLHWIAAASVLLFILSAVFNFTLYKKIENQQAVLQAKPNELSSLPASDFAVISNPTITPVAMYGVGSHAICRCTMFWDKKTGKLYLFIHHLIKSNATKDYQLWAMVNNKPVSVGIVNDDIRGRFIELQNVPAAATSFIVTLEKAGGNKQPTISETYLSGSI